MRRLSHLAPEELVSLALLLIVLAVVALRPETITDLLASPYATPAPDGGGPARQLVPQGVP